MKRHTLLGVLLMLLLLAPMMVMFAQTEEPAATEEADEASEIVALIVQSADFATFIDNGDGTYELTLDGVSENTDYLQEAPELDAGTITTINFAQAWETLPELVVTDAVLQSDTLVLTLDLQLMFFDPLAGTLSYTATVTSVVTVGEAPADPVATEEAMIVPETLEGVTLFLTTNDAFWSELAGAFEALGLRYGQVQCRLCFPTSSRGTPTPTPQR
ncbi:MAG: hypothetical protein MUF87_14550 [Anaerolineae bacterium]|jgi:hypothetical protein|nr:hypothetical protein [Anaerolineae bacterium]